MKSYSFDRHTRDGQDSVLHEAAGLDMTEHRRLKKSEFLEIRLPYPTKQAFMSRCHADGRSASETVRSYIDAHLAGPSRRRRPGRPGRLIAAGAALLICGLVAAPSFARPTAGDDFGRLDLNHDGRVSLTEFGQLASVQIAVAPADGWLRQLGLAPTPALPALDERLRQEVLRAAFAQIDSDRDGEITLGEYRRARLG